MIKVIVERKVKKGKETELHDLLRQVKASATFYPGYISGETLYSLDDPSVLLVVATFVNLEAWHEWEKHPERLKVTKKINPLLERPAKISVYGVA